MSILSDEPSLPLLIIPHQEPTSQQLTALSGPWERHSAAQASSISRRMSANLQSERISFSYYSGIIVQKPAPVLST